ncbi:hypothetical protein [Kaistia adipata]|uniref:hypothetical protein n=1 Tax=Kaistia adipata TaxID=166954 RepID=UPI00048F7650|nr:hypothetical protein [Kaistia adipata]
MSERDVFFRPAATALADREFQRDEVAGSRNRIAELERELAKRDVQIVDLKDRIVVLRGGVLGLVVVWALRELAHW